MDKTGNTDDNTGNGTELQLTMFTDEYGTYTGTFKDGEQNGYGVCHFKNNDVYSGGWKNGRQHGPGVFAWAGGCVYLGCFEDGQKCGLGTETAPDGWRYEGEWCGDKMHGQGTETCPDGVYTGEWANGCKHGQGKQTYVDGRVYEGTWMDGVPYESLKVLTVHELKKEQQACALGGIQPPAV